jgi:hypothetical protein
VRKLEGKLAQVKAPYEAQIRELTAKVKALEGDPNDPKPVTLT